MPKTLFVGKRNNFVADGIIRARKPKIVKAFDYIGKGSNKVLGVGRVRANGLHGAAYDILVFKDNHSRNLVIKKLHKRFNQTATARKEFKLFHRLKEKGYPVPPTVRLVNIRGKEYVALTDLTKFGDLLLKSPSINDLERFLGAKKSKVLMDKMTALSEKAITQGLAKSLFDSWEVVVDTKKKTAHTFILDLTMDCRVRVKP